MADTSNTSRKKKRGVLLFASAVAVGCITVLATFLHAEDWELHYFFSSDTLYLPAIYRDIFVEGGSLSEWWLNAAPNFFPDMGLYFVLHWILGPFTVTSYAFAIVQFALIALLFRAICRESGMAIDERAIAMAVLLMTFVVITGLWGADFGFAFQLLSNAFHMGAFVNALLSTWLLMRVLRGRGYWRLLALALAVFAGAISDKLFWVMFTAPAALSCLLLALRGPRRWRHVGIALLVVASTWCADFSLRSLDDAFPLVIERPYQYLAFERIGFSWGRFLEMLHSYLTEHVVSSCMIVVGLVAMGWTMVHGAWALVAWFKPAVPPLPSADVRPTALRWMIAMFFPMVLLVPVLNGSFDGLDSLRYDFSVFVLAPLVAGTQVAHWAGRRAGLAVLLVGAGIGLPSVWVCLTAGDAYDRIAHYKPERVRTIDRMAHELGLKNGVANYWDAKLMTMFSDEDIFVMPIFADAGVELHVNREGMYYRSIRKGQDPLLFDFVVLHPEITQEYMTRILPRKTAFHELDGVEILVTDPWPFDPATRRPAGAGR
ncbi:MAG: hypothetical protein ABI599_03890 [Flavobacteriales bacterium]